MVTSNIALLHKPKSNLPPPKQKDERERFYITEEEVDLVIKSCKNFTRHSLRNSTLILMLYTHGLRTCEAYNLRWNVIDFKSGHIYVKRVKNSNDSNQPLRGQELRNLRQLKRDYPDSPFVFNSERQTQLSGRTIRYIVAKAGEFASLPFRLRPHMLRHACGYYLVNKTEVQDTRLVQDYMGHKNINHTVRYTKLKATRFNNLWRD